MMVEKKEWAGRHAPVPGAGSNPDVRISAGTSSRFSRKEWIFRNLGGTPKLVFGVLLIAALAGCGSGSEKPAPKKTDAHAGHDHSKDGHTKGDAAKHVHTAPRGGLLVEVGDHGANLEVLLKDTTLTVYLLDAHAENPVRVAVEQIAINVTPAGRTKALNVSLKAVANDLTGEKVGDTSQFQATVPGLASVVEFEAVIPELTLRGSTFKNIEFDFATASHNHDHGDHNDAHDDKPAKP